MGAGPALAAGCRRGRGPGLRRCQPALHPQARSGHADDQLERARRPALPLGGADGADRRGAERELHAQPAVPGAGRAAPAHAGRHQRLAALLLPRQQLEPLPVQRQCGGRRRAAGFGRLRGDGPAARPAAAHRRAHGAAVPREQRLQGAADPADRAGAADMRAQRHGRQGGAALLTAMIIVTLVASLAAAMVWRQYRAVQIESAERARAQATWILQGALDWARLILREDVVSNLAKDNWDHLGEVWNVPLAEARLSSFLSAERESSEDGPEAFLSGSMEDAQSRYNLRQLLGGTQVPRSEEHT